MSKTDKTAPGWLHEFRDGRLVHDHRAGPCRPETLHDARLDAGRSNHHPNGSCAKRASVPVACPGAPACARAARELARLVDEARAGGDWDEICRMNRASVRLAVRCDSHVRAEYDADAPCPGCDERRARPTCEHRFGMPYAHVARMYGAGPPAAYRRYRERAVRSDGREALRMAARDWNSHGDTDLDPGPVRHRHEAGWSWS